MGGEPYTSSKRAFRTALRVSTRTNKRLLLSLLLATLHTGCSSDAGRPSGCQVDYPCFNRTMTCYSKTTYRKLKTFSCEHTCDPPCGGASCEPVGPILSCPKGQVCVSTGSTHDDVCHTPETTGDPSRIGAWVTVQPSTFSTAAGTWVKLTRPFEIAATEVTQGQYNKRVGLNPSQFDWQGDQAPVERVTWHEAASFCNSLSKAAGLTPCYEDVSSGKTCGYDRDCELWASPAPGLKDAPPKEACLRSRCMQLRTAAQFASGAKSVVDCPGYRLPTDAEWEYTYRAGTDTPYHDGSATPDAIGWYAKNATGSTHTVARKKPNAWGLYDLAGNVSEWIHGWASDLGPGLVVDPVVESPKYPYLKRCRGGGFKSKDTALTSASQLSCKPHRPVDDVGFRCVRTLPPTRAGDAGAADAAAQPDAAAADAGADG
jgi:formylglycine-generating enzyme required for sulfatase activity